jgi:hypothetical protein
MREPGAEYYSMAPGLGYSGLGPYGGISMVITTLPKQSVIVSLLVKRRIFRVIV